MKTKLKVLILVLVSALALMALVIPGFAGKPEFHTTNQPQVALAAAKKSGKPIFLEFYAKW
ncbi:hypothetical protein REC12_05955 [Desulfosporosinus sp. PR]|uniref:hypothetical protein n=1 Tax=Candidatus Desulfosporosinus nitrosoreducens TaxID=3401928 RepID=UPI0027EF2662|nr:hypothetical protein [Desulfosporosinus sp. PR]MDQ7093127.1 hypothetical protein [Desulfosporosinus sp. PR]